MHVGPRVPVLIRSHATQTTTILRDRGHQCDFTGRLIIKSVDNQFGY